MRLVLSKFSDDKFVPNKLMSLNTLLMYFIKLGGCELVMTKLHHLQIKLIVIYYYNLQYLLFSLYH
jgi:hypothetical protein